MIHQDDKGIGHKNGVAGEAGENRDGQGIMGLRFRLFRHCAGVHMPLSHGGRRLGGVTLTIGGVVMHAKSYT